MDFLCIGSANQYAKRMARETQWNLKKQSGDFTGHKKSLEDYVNVTKASSVLPQTDEDDKKLSGIMTKAQEGRKLSPDEWEYLRAKNPVMYEKFREMEREQENYEKALRRCKTRDEAQRLHVSKLGEVMSAAKNGDGSALYRLNRLTRTMTAFSKSKEYRELPTEAEEAIARENARQAERDALREETEREETERDAANLSGDDAEIKSETASKSTNDAETKSENVSKFQDDAEIKSESVSKSMDATPNAETSRAVKPQSNATDTGKSANHGGASVIAFGQRAYLNQRDRKSRQKSFEAEA